MRLRYEERALVQLEHIRDWIEERAGADTANRIVDDLLARCEGLTTFPHRGTPRDDIRPGLRTVPHRRRYTIGYRVIGGEVIVLGVRAAGQLDDVLRDAG